MRAGFSKADITVYEPGMLMMGWGSPFNRVDGVATKLHARAMVVEDGVGRRVGYVCVDLCFVSFRIRQEVLRRLEQMSELGLGAHNLMLTATHTHSAPSGISDFAFYNAGTPGPSPKVLERVVLGIVEALAHACERLSDVKLEYAEHEVPVHVPIAFNRSMPAFERNKSADLPVDRTLRALVARGSDGVPTGLLGWFAVHPTSVHSENRLLHHDNKGAAAEQVEAFAREKWGSDTGFVGICAQEAAGDVSPNFRWSPSRKRQVGSVDDDFVSAEHNGAMQAEAMTAAATSKPLFAVERVGGRTVHVDMADCEAAAPFTHGRGKKVTNEATMGFGMGRGTDEGPGPLHGLERLCRVLRDRRARVQADDPKVVLVNLGHGAAGKFLGRLPAGFGFWLGHFDVGVDYLRETRRDGSMGAGPWTPRILPLQLLQVGSLVIAGLPVEPTVTAGRRLRHTILAALPHITHVVINGCANAYTSYVTTFEEYQEQAYEGASTHFGPWTLAAYRTAFGELASRGLGESPFEDVPGPTPPMVSLQVQSGRVRAARRVLEKKKLFSGLLGAQ